MAAGSVLVELFDSSDSIEDRLLKYTLAGGRLKEALRSRKQEKKLRTFAQPVLTLIICVHVYRSRKSHATSYIERAHKYKTNSCIIVKENTVIRNFVYIKRSRTLGESHTPFITLSKI